jgi:hypothetical protein
VLDISSPTSIDDATEVDAFNAFMNFKKAMKEYMKVSKRENRK